MNLGAGEEGRSLKDTDSFWVVANWVWLKFIARIVFMTATKKRKGNAAQKLHTDTEEWKRLKTKS